MPITTLSQTNKSVFPKVILYILILGFLGTLIYFGKDLVSNLGNLKGKAVLSVTTQNAGAQVILNDKDLGQTPLRNQDIIAGNNKIGIKENNRQYQTTINFLPNSEVVVTRDLGVSDNFSSGQNFWIEKSNSQTVLSITSDPSNTSVFIDNTEVGKTPYSSSTLTPGEYDLRVENDGFEGQVARIKVQKGFNLNIALKLFPTPVPDKVGLLTDSQNLYDLTSGNPLVTLDTQNWVKAVIYWNQTRGINLSGTGVNKEPVFDFYIDYKGNLYDKNGNIVTNPQDNSDIKKAIRGAYLGRSSDGQGLTQEAKFTYGLISNSISTGKTVTIGSTGTGWLRVRQEPNLNAAEVAKVNTGDSYPLLEEQTDWVKIKVSDSVQGWVSKTYVQVSQ